MKTAILPPNETSLFLAKRLIERGEVVAFPTETVYGLGANAFEDDAVRKIFSLKGRPSDNPLIVHVHESFDYSELIDGEMPYVKALKEAFLPGPLTMIYPSTNKVSGLVSCGLNTLAIRVPSSPAAQAFLRAVSLPIAAPSANLSKHVSPVTAEHVFEDFEGKIPLILDGGACLGGIESTVLDCTGEVPLLLREGLISREMIAKVAGDCKLYRLQRGEKPKSPGLSYRHYTPRCETSYYREDELTKAKDTYLKEEANGGEPYFLCRSEILPALSGMRAFDLGSTAEEMAHRLYYLLREAEKRATLLIGIEPKIEGGASGGVLNRMRRAFGAAE